MSLIERAAEVGDYPIVQRIVDSHQRALDPKEKRFGESEARHVINGFFEPATTRLIRNSAADNWQSFITLNPDASRSRAYLDIYSEPESGLQQQSFEIALGLARQEYPSYRLWLGVNSKDREYQRILEDRGFSILRKYWTMEVTLVGPWHDQPPPKVQIREIDLGDDDDVFDYWSVHQDAFSGHFGFVPRELSGWTELVRRDQGEVKMRVWILSVDGEDAGFVDCDDSLVHEGGGFVSGLGVRYAFQGKGFGEILLRFAMKETFERGLEKLLLSVDTGNESGALRLYEKVGMKPISEWHHYENLDWNSESRGS